MQKDTHSFIVRIWQETLPGEDEAVVWRGSIEAVGIGQRSYFSDLQGVIGFIQEQLALQANLPSGGLRLAWMRFNHGFRAIWKRLSGKNNP